MTPKSSWRMVRTSTASVSSTPVCSGPSVAMVSSRDLLHTTSQKLARVHAQNLAGDTACTRTAQKEHGGGYIGNFEQIPQHTFRFRGLAGGSWQCFRQWCSYPARLDHVHQNSKAAGFAGDAFGQAQQSRFAG